MRYRNALLPPEMKKTMKCDVEANELVSSMKAIAELTSN